MTSIFVTEEIVNVKLTATLDIYKIYYLAFKTLSQMNTAHFYRVAYTVMYTCVCCVYVLCCSCKSEIQCRMQCTHYKCTFHFISL